MHSYKAILLFACIAFVAGRQVFFNNVTPGEGGNRGRNREPENPLMANQRAQGGNDYSSVYASDGGADGGAGGGAGGATSDSTEVNVGAAAGAAGAGAAGAAGDADEADDMAGNDAAGNDAAEVGDAGETADQFGANGLMPGGNSGADSPSNMGGGPGQQMNGKAAKSAAGRNAGIAFGVIAVVGLAAGCGYYVFRKRRAAAYGSRF